MPASPPPTTRRMDRFGAIPDEVLYAALDDLPAEPFRLLVLLYKLAHGRDNVAVTEQAVAAMLSGPRRAVGVASVRRWVERLAAEGWLRRRPRGQGKRTVYVLPFTAYDHGTRRRFAHPEEPVSPLKLERSKRGGWRRSPLKDERSNPLVPAAEAGLTAQTWASPPLKHERSAAFDRPKMSGQATHHGDMVRDKDGDSGAPAPPIRHPAKSVRRAAVQRGLPVLGGVDRVEELPQHGAVTPLSAAQVWGAAVLQLEAAVPTAAFNSFVKYRQAVGWRDGGTLVVDAGTTFGRDYLEERLRGAVEQAVRGLVPGAGVAFELPDQAAAAG